MQRKLLALLLACCLLLSLVLSGCGRDGEEVPQTTAPEETVPAETVPADGNPDDITCKGSYTVDTWEATSNARLIVAETSNGKKLTNGQLQMYYWLAVAAYRQGDSGEEPDFSRSLDTQVCTIDSSVATWQQYFLRQALNAWHSRQALVTQGELEGVPTEAAYKPDEEKHTAYLSDKPATRYLYGHFDSYVPNEIHQAYLDNLDEHLETAAQDCGFADIEAMADAIAGEDAKGTDLRAVAELANRAYMYFTEMGYHFEPKQEEITAHYEANREKYEARGLVPGGEKSVDLIQILLIPEDAQVAGDGTVTCSEDAWKACRVTANGLLEKWEKAISRSRFTELAPVSVRQTRFSELAKDYSRDAGSASNGGIYSDIRRGQLIQELDDWCFDASRQYGDVEILRSAAGLHIVFFAGETEDWYAAAQADLIAESYVRLAEEAMARYPAEIDYSAIRLAQAPDNGSFVTISHLLYPDVAHERFPSMPLYLQQDYPEAPYGDYKLSSHGCGITTLAMVASYLADEELTPPELALQYGYYCGLRGTEIVIFDDTPAQMGFYLDRRSGGWDEIHTAVESGQVVVSLQYAGYWTGGGHYLAIIDTTEDGRYVVRDSNLINYKRIPAHVQDSHTRGSIIQAGQYYWIYEPKVVRISACARCGMDNMEAPPRILFREDYHCVKCGKAMTRRDCFLSGITG